MLSFEISNVNDHGPQHSTPVKESFLSKIQSAENDKHPIRTGRVAELSDVKVNNASHRHYECELLHQADLNHHDASPKSDCFDSIIDISQISEIQNISVHSNDISNTVHDDDNRTISSNHALDCPETNSSLHTKQTPGHQNQHALIHKSPPTSVSLKHGKLEKDPTFNRRDAVRNVHTGTQYSRPLLSDCFSDSDLSKQSTSPRTTWSFIKVAMSPSKQKMVKSYRRVRSSSLPRSLLTDVNICNSVDYNLPGCSMSDFRKTSSVYIEQDIINKQRQEIQLLMEELGNRDQELNDLVISHQKQVKAWESDNEKLVSLQGRLNQYEEELKIRENQLKETLSEMARVNEQREVDAVELKRTQNEMIKLAERIMENSVYIKEMEAQNQKLSLSLRDFVTARQSFSAREQELLVLIDDKESNLNEQQKEIDKMVEHIKYLECQCEQLGERNNNTAVESVNWRKKYIQIKEEADRLNAECRLKEENVQKMTQQLHESLQQAIALQKALFTSCEREKCKEEVMYSLRKQHKRTMQELQNIRELYDRLSRDTTLYHLSVKEKDSGKDVKKKEDADGLSKKYRGDNLKHDEDSDKRRQDGKRRHDSNMSKLKHPEASEQSFLVKETKERRQVKEEKIVEKNANKTNEKNVASSAEQKAGKNDSSKSSKGKADEVEDHGSKIESIAQVTPQKLVDRITPKVIKNEHQTSTLVKSCHTTMCRNAATITSSTSLFSEDVNAQRLRARKFGLKVKNSHGDSKGSDVQGASHENTSKNADNKDTRSLSSSHVSTVKSVQSRTTSPFTTLQEASKKRDASIMERANDARGDSSSDASNNVSPSRFDDELTPADSDGMCHELQRDMSRIQHLDKLSPMLEASGFESRSSRTPSNSLPVPKKSSFLKKDKTDKKTSFTGDEESAALKPNPRKRAVEFDASDDLTKSVSAETQSQYLGPDSETYSPPTAERRPCIVTRGNAYPNTQPFANSNCLSNKQSPGGRKDNGLQHGAEASNVKNHSSGNAYLQGRGRYLHDANETEQKQEGGGEYGHKNSLRQKENNSSQWNIGSCGQCKAQGKSYCNCAMVQRSHTAFANQTMGNFEGDLAKNDTRFSCHGGLASGSSKLTFNEIDSLLEYNSSLSKSQNRQLQPVDRSRMPMCSSPDDGNSSAFRHSDQKTHVLDDEPVHDQTVLVMSHKICSQDLPERITTYLAKNSSVRREMFNNNNNTCADHIVNFDLYSNCKNCRCEKNTPLQDGNWVTCVDYKVADNEDDSLLDSVLLPIDTEDVPDLKVLNLNKTKKEEDTQQQTHIKTVKADNMLHKAAEMNKEQKNSKTCHSAYLDFENKRDVIIETVAGPSKLNENMTVQELMMLEAGRKDCHSECISCHTRTKLAADSNLHPEISVLNRRDERLCKSNLEKQNVRFTQAASAPACLVSLPSWPAREPSLYKQLSLIHFSEATRRYEWVTQPVLPEHISQREVLHNSKSHDHKSANNQLSDLKSCDMIHTANSQLQDSITQEVTDSRSVSQSSDSGHYSLSGGSTDHSFHLAKPIDCSDYRSEIDSSHLFKSNRNKSPCSEITINKIFALANKNSRQYKNLHNKSGNSNNNCDVSHLQSSPNERSTLSHGSVMKCDTVVKKLDFSDTALEDSRAESGSLVLSLSGQHCLPACDSDEGKNQNEITTRISPVTTKISCNNECSFLSEKGKEVQTWKSVTHSSPHCIDPVGAICCHDKNSPRLMNISHVGHSDALQVENEAYAEGSRRSFYQDTSEFIIHPLDDIDVFSAQNGKNMNIQKEGHEKEIEVHELYTEEEDMREISSVQYGDDLGKINSSHRNLSRAKNKKEVGHHNKHILVPEGEDYYNNVIKIYDPGTCWNAERTPQMLQGCCEGQHYNLASHKQAEGILEDTRDSNGFVDCQTRDMSASSVWECEDSVEDVAVKCDNTMSAFLDVSTQSDESFMGTALSPMSRLYRLLVESHAMINSLEKNSAVPEAVELEIPLSPSH